MSEGYDIIIFGGGIAGLFIANRLQCAGYNLILIEKDRLGAGQTLASQGMIHGGQKYAIHGRKTGHSESIAAMPGRWEACFAGTGEVDLSAISFLSESQVMFPAGSFFSRLAVFAAAFAVRGRTKRLGRAERPQVLKQGPVYQMQEKVLDTKSLIAALAQNIEGRIFKGEAEEMQPDGQVVVSGKVLQAQMIIFTAGTGNEAALRLLRIKEDHTQRRPLRQIMVKPMEEALYGHGIVGEPKPRVTVTSHPVSENDYEYVWYLGGNVAEKTAQMPEEEALSFAKQEMREIFPHIDWENKEWASYCIDRAEPLDAKGILPPGPHIQQRGKILFSWPTKMTFAPALADAVMQRLEQSGVTPSSESMPPLLLQTGIGLYPWEEARWQRL